VSDTILNQGAGPSGRTTTRFYLSTNFSLDSSDTPLPGSRSVPELAGGAAHSGLTVVTLPAEVTTGAYYIIARSDDGADVVETQEGNNIAARGVVVGPDLRISIGSITSPVAPGGSAHLTQTVTNQGGGAAGASLVRYYLSANTLVDANDVPLAATHATSALTAGAADTRTVAVPIPASVAAGVYYLLALADGNAEVVETAETNNIAARAITVQ
jgi:subtilase family serine protease